MSWGASFVLALILSTAWMYVITNYAAFKDGCRNQFVFRAAWWPCHTARNYNVKLEVLKAALDVHLNHESINTRTFALDCAIVVRNNIMRCNSHQVDLSNLKIQGVAFETHVNRFNKSIKRSTQESD